MRPAPEAGQAKDPLPDAERSDPLAKGRNLTRKGPFGGDPWVAQADGQPQHEPRPARNDARAQTRIPGGDRCRKNADQNLSLCRAGDRRVVKGDALGRPIGGVAGDLHDGSPCRSGRPDLRVIYGVACQRSEVYLPGYAQPYPRLLFLVGSSAEMVAVLPVRCLSG